MVCNHSNRTTHMTLHCQPAVTMSFQLPTKGTNHVACFMNTSRASLAVVCVHAYTVPTL